MPTVDLTSPIPGARVATKFQLGEILLGFEARTFSASVLLVNKAGEVVQTQHINGLLDDLQIAPGFENALKNRVIQVLKDRGVIN